MYEPSEIEVASKFIDESASQISNMKKFIDDLIIRSNSLNNNSTYLQNDPIFKKVNVALNNIKSSLQTNGSKISKQVGLIKSNAGMIEYKDDVITSIDNGDMQISDLHDIVILPDIDVDEEDDEFNLTLMLPPFMTQLSSSSSSSH